MKESSFNYGIMIAASNIVALHDQPVIAADIIKEAGLANFNCKEMSEYDKENLKVVNKEKGMTLRGL